MYLSNSQFFCCQFSNKLCLIKFELFRNPNQQASFENQSSIKNFNCEIIFKISAASKKLCLKNRFKTTQNELFEKWVLYTILIRVLE